MSDRDLERDERETLIREEDDAGVRTGVDAAGSDFERDATVVRHEEEAEAVPEARHAGSVRVRKLVETDHYEQVVPRGIENADFERTGPHPSDSGEIETLPDGSVSVPVFEEEIVITKRKVVRERVIVRKHTVTEEHTVEAQLRRERVEIDADPGVELVDEQPTVDDGA